jgi:hypothetical protein
VRELAMGPVGLAPLAEQRDDGSAPGLVDTRG